MHSIPTETRNAIQQILDDINAELCEMLCDYYVTAEYGDNIIDDTI